jgi:hypothetical protein
VRLEGGCGRLGPWRGTAGQGSTDRGCNWAVAKPSTKVLNAKKIHKFVFSVVVRIVYLRQEVHSSKLDLLKKIVFSVFSYITLFFRKFLIINCDDLYFFSHV